MENVKGKILVIDDEKTVHESCSRILHEEGFEVDSTLSGKAGLVKLRETFYDLVLLDIKMADMDGLRTLEEIKKEVPGITVVMITGYPSFESARDSMKIGAFDYLAKPFTPKELTQTVKKALGQESKRIWEREDGARIQAGETPGFTAASVMRSKLVTCDPGCSVQDVCRKMIHENVRSILVKQDDEMKGIIVDKNILDIVVEGKDCSTITASHVMSSPLECCNADDSLEKCMTLFDKTGHSRLVVLQEGQVVGILLKKFAKRFLILSKRFSLSEISPSPRFRTGRW
jgi:CheY-like chemotaxis protein/CBS domain-containing protein